MLRRTETAIVGLLLTVPWLSCTGCAGLNVTVSEQKTISTYENHGKRWGQVLQKRGKVPEDAIDGELVAALIGSDIDYFNVHSDLKDAFKSGFRVGYAGRVADLVLGPNIRKAAGEIGFRTAKGFVDVINTFETGWGRNLDHAVRVFIVLLSEGSQADREYFIERFVSEYKPKFDNTMEVKSTGGYIKQTSEGGATLYIDVKKTVAVMDIPSPETLKGEIYKQAFRSMGDEWGKRFSTNLIKRNELIDLLRRIKPALREGASKTDSLEGNLGLLKSAFVESYGSDAASVFDGLIKDAGYETTKAARPRPEEVRTGGEASERTPPLVAMEELPREPVAAPEGASSADVAPPAPATPERRAAPKKRK